MNAVSGDFTPASRAMLVGAMLGGVASGASHIQAKKSGLETNDDFLSKVLKDTIKAGAVSGVTTLIATKMSGQPVLSMLTLASVGAAGLYFLDQHMDDKND